MQCTTCANFTVSMEMARAATSSATMKFLFAIFFLAFPAWGENEKTTTENFVQHFGKLDVLTHVANFFPNPNATAFLSLGDESKINRLAYSQGVSDSLSLEQHIDFVITFKKSPKEG